MGEAFGGYPARCIGADEGGGASGLGEALVESRPVTGVIGVEE